MAVVQVNQPLSEEQASRTKEGRLLNYLRGPQCTVSLQPSESATVAPPELQSIKSPPFLAPRQTLSRDLTPKLVAVTHVWEQLPQSPHMAQKLSTIQRDDTKKHIDNTRQD